MQAVRKLDLKKPPVHQRDARLGARADAAQRGHARRRRLVADTLSTILKYEADIAKAKEHLSYIAGAELH